MGVGVDLVVPVVVCVVTTEGLVGGVTVGNTGLLTGNDQSETVGIHCLVHVIFYRRLTCLLRHITIIQRIKINAPACLYTVFIRESNKQKKRMAESKTKESILVFYSHNITI